MWKLLEKFFLIPTDESKSERKTIKDLDLLDSVWVKDDDIIYSGWIFDITRRSIIVCYGNDLRDYRFRTNKLGNEELIEQDNKTLYCNNPDGN